MTTAANMVKRSLRLIQVINTVQPIKAEDAQTGIKVMNAMLTRWEANGLSLGWTNVDNPSDVLPLPPEAEEAVAYNLAVRLAPEYGVEVSLVVGRGSVEFLADLRRAQAVATPIQPLLDVPCPDWYGARTFRSTVWNG